jgi:signal transduction histidine kinase
MPQMDGMELLIHSKEHYPETEVIVMTGYSSQYSYIDVIKAGAADFIEKPFKKDEFAAKLNRIFREKNLLKELKEAKEKAEAGSKAKSAFLNTISHEIRTPMNGIIGFIDILSNSELPSPEKGYVEILSQSSKRLMKLFSQILDFAAMEAGNSDIKPLHFQLQTVFDDLRVAIRPSSEEKGLKVSLESDEELAKILLFGDKMALEQILYNLTDNAIKFTDSGSIEIKVQKTKELSGNIIELQFSIRDTGCGLAPEKQVAIFEPFTQAEEYLTRKHEGAGLGLAICAKLILMMNGKIWLESKVGQGSTFHFTVKMTAA